MDGPWGGGGGPGRTLKESSRLALHEGEVSQTSFPIPGKTWDSGNLCWPISPGLTVETGRESVLSPLLHLLRTCFGVQTVKQPRPCSELMHFLFPSQVPPRRPAR